MTAALVLFRYGHGEVVATGWGIFLLAALALIAGKD